MCVYKIYVKGSLFVLLFVSFINCNSQKKKNIESINVTSKTDTFPKYPKYLNKNYVLGKFDYTKNTDFVVVPKKISNKKIYVRKEVLTAFLKMQNEANKNNISFKVISGTRNFTHQKRIWNYKWNEKYKNIPVEKRVLKILEFSAMPSTSRHHWGTDLDLNNLNNSYFSSGKGLKEYNWLIKNASKFGFYQVYTSKKNGRTGYNEEKWHWSYLPLSSIYLTFYNQKITNKDITNFKGEAFIGKIDVIKNFVNGINSKIVK